MSCQNGCSESILGWDGVGMGLVLGGGGSKESNPLRKEGQRTERRIAVDERRRCSSVGIYSFLS